MRAPPRRVPVMQLRVRTCSTSQIASIRRSSRAKGQRSLTTGLHHLSQLLTAGFAGDDARAIRDLDDHARSVVSVDGFDTIQVNNMRPVDPDETLRVQPLFEFL